MARRSEVHGDRRRERGRVSEKEARMGETPDGKKKNRMRKRRDDSGGGGGGRRGVGWRGELFIAVNGCAVHKDCSEGYPKEKGATKTASSHLNKRMETETGSRDNLRLK